MGLLAALRRDITAIQQRDPAAGGVLDVVLYYPGLHAVWAHRVAHQLSRGGARGPARGLSHVARMVTDVEIHPAAQIGAGLFIDHGSGVVIGETAQIGRDCTLYHGVTLGGTSLDPVKRHPTLGDRVIVGAGAKILGAIEVGDDSRIGANSVLVRAVVPASVVVGMPGQVVVPRAAPAEQEHDDRRDQPDLVGMALAGLLDRMDGLESALGLNAPLPGSWRHTGDGVWLEESDFSILQEQR